ncbi:MAG TPA: hypothetical protein VIL20_27640, partial [Sandaracinaceae bacterium]
MCAPLALLALLAGPARAHAQDDAGVPSGEAADTVVTDGPPEALRAASEGGTAPPTTADEGSAAGEGTGAEDGPQPAEPAQAGPPRRPGEPPSIPRRAIPDYDGRPDPPPSPE